MNPGKIVMDRNSSSARIGTLLIGLLSIAQLAATATATASAAEAPRILYKVDFEGNAASGWLRDNPNPRKSSS